MAIKTQYFCKKSRNYVIPETLDSQAQGGLVLIVGLNCDCLSSGFCAETGHVCQPYRQAKKDARHQNKQHINQPREFVYSKGIETELSAQSSPK